MSQELHYTSVPRGLRPGTRGFCTVAATPQVAGPLAERLEILSGYQPVYPAHDPLSARNPINFAHTRFTLGGRPASILSRVGPAGLDYTGRANKYAHHVVIDAAERPDGGPAWLLEQPGFMQQAWDGEPRTLPEGRPVPRGDRPAGVATAWAAAAGDAGWAGVLAESFLADPKRPAFLVFRPGVELLPLFSEAIALLPPPRRWDVEFSTYLTQAPRGIAYAWRGVLEGSPEAEGARRLPGALVIDLGAGPRHALGGPLVLAARTGQPRAWTEATAIGGGAMPPPPPASPVRGMPPPVGPPGPFVGPPGRETAGAGNTDLIPELAARLAGGHLSPGRSDPSRQAGRPGRFTIAAVAIVCLGLIGTAGFLFRRDLGRAIGLSGEVREQLADSRRVVEEKKQEIQQAEASAAKPDPAAATQSESGDKEPPKTRVAEARTDDKDGKPAAEKKAAPAVPAKAAPAKQPDSTELASTTVEPRFLPLAEPVSFTATTNDQKEIDLGRPAREVKGMTLIGRLGDGWKCLFNGGEEPQLVVRQESPSDGPSGDGLRGKRKGGDLAAYHVSSDGKLQFNWSVDGPEDRRAERDWLRGCVLRIESGAGMLTYVVPRQPPSGPRESRRFEGQIRPERDHKYVTFVYRWDDENVYQDRLASLTLEDCLLTTDRDKVKRLKRKSAGSWTLKHGEETLLSVELGQIKGIKGRETLHPIGGNPEPADPPHDRPRKAGSTDGNPLPKSARSTVLVVTLHDDEPETLGRRILERKDTLAAETKAAKKAKDGEKTDEQVLRRIEEEIQHLGRLQEIYRSTLDVKICWKADEARLEIARLRSKALAPEAGQPRR